MLIVWLLLLFQTAPRWNQVPARQVRIGDNDTTPITMIRLKSILCIPWHGSDGSAGCVVERHTKLLSDFKPGTHFVDNWPDAPLTTKVICSYEPFRFDLEGVFTPSSAKWIEGCYSKLGQDMLLTDPEWADWYSKQ